MSEKLLVVVVVVVCRWTDCSTAKAQRERESEGPIEVRARLGSQRGAEIEICNLSLQGAGRQKETEASRQARQTMFRPGEMRGPTPLQLPPAAIRLGRPTVTWEIRALRVPRSTCAGRALHHDQRQLVRTDQSLFLSGAIPPVVITRIRTRMYAADPMLHYPARVSGLLSPPTAYHSSREQ